MSNITDNRKEYQPQWEDLKNPKRNEDTFRMPVPGGWVVRQSEWAYSDRLEELSCVSSSMVFVPDPTHEWKFQAIEPRYESSQGEC